MSVAEVTPQTYTDMLGQSHQLFEDMKALVADPKTTTEERARIPQMVKDAKDLQGRAASLKQILDAGLDQVAVPPKGDPLVPDTKRISRTSEFKNWGGFLRKTWEAGHPQYKGPPDPRLAYFRDDEASDKKDMSGASGAAGGYLIPAEFQAQLQAATAERSIVRSRATIIPMRRRQLDIPVLDQTGATAGLPHWFGGMVFYWAEEAGAKTETDAIFRQVSLVARKLIGYTRCSDELVDDSAISLEAFFSGPLGMAGGVAWMEDYAFLMGTGAGQPLGIIPAPCTIQEGRVAANAVALADIIDMLEHFLPGGRGIWIANQTLLPSIYTLNGPAGNASYVWIPNARDTAPGTLFGYPLVFSEKPPALGTAGDIGIYDMSYYVIGDRQATTVESTKFDRWSYDQTSWRVVHRVDGQPWLSAPLTLQDGVSTVSPFVILGGAVGS